MILSTRSAVDDFRSRFTIPETGGSWPSMMIGARGLVWPKQRHNLHEMPHCALNTTRKPCDGPQPYRLKITIRVRVTPSRRTFRSDRKHRILRGCLN